MEEKTHAPTEKKLRDARRRGEVVHSSDVASSLVFVVLVVSLWMLPGVVTDLFRALWVQASDPELWAQADARWIDVAKHAGAVLLLVCVPVCALAALTGIFGSFIQIGALAAWSRLQPDVNRLNPGEGIKKLFSFNNVIDLAKMLAKVLLLGALLYAVLLGHLTTASRIGYLSPAGQLSSAGSALLTLLGWAAVIFVALAPADYLHRRFDFMKKQRMSLKDLQRENKETEGDPLTQSRRRSAQYEAAFRSVADRVRAATLVVHSRNVALALQYVSATEVPRVIAVGQGPVAEQICRLAREQMLYVESNPELADRLQREAALDRRAPQVFAEPLAKLLRRAQGLE